MPCGAPAAWRRCRSRVWSSFSTSRWTIPLVRVPDPVFLGFHCREGARISAKVIEKAYPEEKLGVIVTTGGKQAVIEYSDLDEALMQRARR